METGKFHPETTDNSLQTLYNYIYIYIIVSNKHMRQLVSETCMVCILHFVHQMWCHFLLFCQLSPKHLRRPCLCQKRLCCSAAEAKVAPNGLTNVVAKNGTDARVHHHVGDKTVLRWPCSGYLRIQRIP